MNMSQTDQRNGGMTTSAHQISIGVLNSGLPRTFHRVAVDARGVSTSPPGRRFSISGSDQRSRRAEPPRRQNSLTIRRLSWQLNSGNDSGQTNRTGSVSVARRICVHPDPAGRPPPHISVSADTVNRSIHTLTLIQPAPAISIMIGGAGSNPAGPRDKLTTLSESSNHSPKSPLQSIKESASFDLGIPVDSAAELLQNTSHTSFTVVPSSDTPCVRSPVSIEVGNAKPVLVCRPHDTISQRIFLGSLSDPPSVHRCDIISSRPPLPQVDADSKTGKTLVRISSGSRGLVVAASSSNEVHIVTPTVALRSRSPSVPRGILRPCGSCDNLLSRRLQLDTSTPAEFSPVKPLFHHFVLRGRSASEQDPPLHHRLSHGNLIEQLNCDMPNAPLPAGLGSAKASCLPHVGPNNQMSGTNAIPTRPRSSILSEAMSGDPTPPYTEVSGGIVGMPAMASVSSSGNNKPVASPGLGRIKHQRLSSSNSGSHQSQYFRVQLPCTRANARPKGFAPTDSLKLYEDQILNYSGAGAQRPQSWCIDLGQLGDEIALIDDSHSASPASTVSSRSSSSSDTSQSPSFNRNYHHPLPHIDRPYSGAFPNAHAILALQRTCKDDPKLNTKASRRCESCG
ncbi:unnamed protein product [Calicophoron daubneyi]|uniref:Uncharacterized protein n=1 Tax=Calicophoron daubneyi TaxID=300641 RepID=A0AAV2T413_CALDB